MRIKVEKELMLMEETLENNDQKVYFYTGLPNMGYSLGIAEIYPTLFWQ